MITRHMRNKEEKRKGYSKKLIVKFSIPKFRNPVQTYKLSEGLYVSESKLLNPEDRSSFLDALFDFNRIVACSSFSTMIKCNLQSYNPSNAYLPYFLERIKSLGDRDLYKFSNKIQQVCQTKTDNMIVQKAISLPTSEQLVKKYANDMCIIMMRDVSPISTTFNQLLFSKSLLRLLGVNEQEAMLAAVKYGCLGNGESSNIDIISMDYTKQLELYLNCQLEFQKFLESDDLVGFNEIAKSAVVESAWKTVSNNKERIDWKCTFHIPCPNAIVIKFEYSEPNKMNLCESMSTLSSLPVEFESPMVEERQEEEFSILKNLVTVPENFLKINKNYVCKLRHAHEL